MNLKLLLGIILLNLTGFTYANIDNSNFIDKLVSAFDNKSLLNNWSYNRKHKELVDVVKEIVDKVKDILIVIDKPEYGDLKNMIIKCDTLLLDKTENLYLETRIIKNSIARIVKTHERYKKECDTLMQEHYSSKSFLKNDFESKSRDRDLEAFFNDMVLNEYKIVYSCLMRKIKKIAKINLPINDTQFNEKISRKRLVPKLEQKIFDSLKFSINTSRKMIEDIIKVDNTQHTYILASYKGISYSHKCFLNEKNDHLFFDYLLLFQDPSFINLESSNIEYNEKMQSFMELFMCKKLVFNKSALRLFISLIHIFTKISGQNTKYEIYLNDKGLYEIEWSYGRLFGKNWFKNYYLKKNIPFSSPIKHKIVDIAYLDNNSVGYSILKIKNLKVQTNKIRLLLLSCGHQLGLKQLDNFFEKCYDIKFGRTNCPICGLIITVVGSHDVFYEQLKRIKSLSCSN